MELPACEQGIKKIGKACVARANFPVALSQDYASAVYASGSGFSLAAQYIGAHSKDICIPTRNVPRAVAAPDASWVFTYPFYEQDGAKARACGYLYHAEDGFGKSIRCVLPTAVSSQSIVACALGVQQLVVRSRFLVQIAEIENLIYQKIISKDPFDLAYVSIKRGYPKITSDRGKDFFLQPVNDESVLVVAGDGDEVEILAKASDTTWYLSARQVFKDAITFVQVNKKKKLIGVSTANSSAGIFLYTDTLEEYARVVLSGFSPQKSFSISPCGNFLASVADDEKTINVYTIIYTINSLFPSPRRGGYTCSERIKDAQLAWTSEGILFGTRHYGYIIFTKKL